MGIYDVEPGELVNKTAEKLKSIPEIKAPEWAQFVKTGMAKDRPPVSADWWYTRSASVLRKIFILGPVGVSKLRTQYGSNHRRGYKPARFALASGNILRKILQQLEKAGLAAMAKKPRVGRILTPKGISFLDSISSEIMKTKNITLPKKSDVSFEPQKGKKKSRKKAPKKKAAKKEESA